MIFLKGKNQIFSSYPNVILTIGNYDGLHLGHRRIIEEMIKQAKKDGGTSVVYTFRPHPHVVVRPQSSIELISTYEEKTEMLNKMGVDVVVEEPFSREFSNISAQSFFQEVVLKRLNTKKIFVGYDFGFGKERSGTLERLNEFCLKNGIEIRVFEPFQINGEICSSSRIRTLLKAGNVKQANELLGRRFFYREVVVKGNRRGHQLGFATANLHNSQKIQIKEGVYASQTKVRKSGEIFLSITNIGRQPTFNIGKPGVLTIETHILDFERDIYGEEIEVSLVDRLRDEQKFSCIDELKKQISADIISARQILSGLV